MKSEQKPFLSVVIPVYNAEEYLRQCIESLLGSSFKEMEIICVDDGSTDSSREIVKSYMAPDMRVRLICQENQHAGVARNTGLKHAAGKYVHFLDADDYVLDYAYESIYHAICRYEPDCIKFCAIAYDESAKKTVFNNQYEMGDFAPDAFNCFLGKEHTSKRHHLCVTPWTGIYRKAFLEEHDICFNDLFCVNDRSFFEQVVTTAERVVAVRDRLVVHRINLPGSLVGRRAEHFDCHMKSIRLIEKNLLSAQVEQSLFDCVMKKEFSDLMFWCEKFARDQALGKSILDQTERFLHEFSYDFMYMFLNRFQKAKAYAQQTEPSETPIPVGATNRENVYKRYFYEQSEKPEVSVLLPVYYGAETLHEAFHSLLKKLPEASEIICVDFGMSEVALTVAKEYAAVDHRIRIAEKKPAGFRDFLDIGMELIRGEAFDVVVPDALTDDRFDVNECRPVSTEDKDILKSQILLQYLERENEIRTAFEQALCALQRDRIDLKNRLEQEKKKTEDLIRQNLKLEEESERQSEELQKKQLRIDQMTNSKAWKTAEKLRSIRKKIAVRK